MPLHQIEQTDNRQWGIWKITEDEQTLLDQVSSYESIPELITNREKRLEFIAGRVMTKILVEKSGGIFAGVGKDVYGKPLLKNNTLQVSLSHSYPYVAAIISGKPHAGIDLEQIKPKLLRVASRVLHPHELLDAGDDVTKHCVYWCAKEALIKVYGKKDLVFAEQLLIAPFPLHQDGVLSGRIIVNGTETFIPLQYRVLDGFAIVYTI